VLFLLFMYAPLYQNQCPTCVTVIIIVLYPTNSTISSEPLTPYNILSFILSYYSRFTSGLIKDRQCNGKSHVWMVRKKRREEEGAVK
jgi:hypothetical protein